MSSTTPDTNVPNVMTATSGNQAQQVYVVNATGAAGLASLNSFLLSAPWNADGTTPASFGNSLYVTAGTTLFNGTSFDRQRSNQDNIVAVASASYTTTQTQTDQTNYNSKGLIAVLDMTTVGTGSVTLEIDGKDPVSGKYYAILTGAAVTTNSTNVYTVYPGNTVAANASASTVLPRTWRIKVTANNANAATYSVGAMLIL